MNVLDRSATVAAVLLGLGLAWSLAEGLWFFVGGAGAETSETEARPTPRPGVQTASSVPSAAAIAAARLFGEAGATPAAGVAGMDAPETRLQLELQGVFLGTRPAASSAIVAPRNRPGRLYGVGDTLPGNAELVRVLADRIVLRRGGVLETLRFPETRSVGGFQRSGGTTTGSGDVDRQVSAAARPTAGGPRGRSATGVEPNGASAAADYREQVRSTLERYRDELARDPDGTLERLGVEPVTSGAAQGYRIGDEAPASTLAQVGLERGDVVLSVNGQPVGDVQQDRQQLQAVMDAGAARLEIQRGDRRFFVTTRLE